MISDPHDEDFKRIVDPISEEEKTKWAKVRATARVIHFFSFAYLLGQSFSVFLYGTRLDTTVSGAGLILEIIFLVALIVSGIMSMTAILKVTAGNE